MPSLLSRLMPVYLRVTGAQRVYRTAAAAERRVAERRDHPRPFDPPRRLRADVTVTRSDVGGWPVFTIAPADGAVSGGLVYLHGGAWVNEIAPQHWQLVAQLAATARLSVTLPIYPLVPRGTAADVVDGTVGLVLASIAEHGTASLAGDSAGGQIALSAAIALRDRHGVKLPRTVLIAPALDLSMSNPEMDVVQPSDPWLAKPGTRVFIDLWRAGLPFDDPRVSPLAADLRGLGPLTVFCGTRDILHPDGVLLAAKAREAGVEVDWHEGEGLVHVYPLTPTPEGRAARLTIVEQLRAR